jgi:AcrR family transcriptional regulator
MSLPLERPVRADARRNYDLLVTAARQAFLERGSDASLEDIARRAGVGIGTLYRRFPTRQALLEAVYLEEIQTMCEGAAKLADLPPWEGLVTWLRDFVEFGLTKDAVAHELVTTLGKESEFFTACKTTIVDTATLFFARAREAGEVRRDVDILDVLRLVSGIAHTTKDDPEQAKRMLDLILAGLRPR